METQLQESQIVFDDVVYKVSKRRDDSECFTVNHGEKELSDEIKIGTSDGIFVLKKAKGYFDSNQVMTASVCVIQLPDDSYIMLPSKVRLTNIANSKKWDMTKDEVRVENGGNLLTLHIKETVMRLSRVDASVWCDADLKLFCCKEHGEDTLPILYIRKFH